MGDGNDRQTFTHESFGLVGLSRTSRSGNTTLFGSRLDKHHATMFLRVYRGKREHEHARDWFGTDGRVPIVEVELSAAQFAEFVTTANMGEGVPCTIRSIEGRRMANPPDAPNEAQAIEDNARVTCEQIAESVNAIVDEAQSALAAAKVSAKHQEAVLAPLRRAVRKLSDELPFAASSLRESMEHTVASAKAEVDAAVTHMIQAAGLDHLRNLPAGNVVPALPEKANDEDDCAAHVPDASATE